MFVKIRSAAISGIDAIPITVEVDVAGSWPGYQIVGLPDTAIQEAKERIRTAWKNSGLHFPANSRILVNLAPADVRKEGTAFDAPMALGMYLASIGRVDIPLEDALVVGELALDGTLRNTSGILPIALAAARHGIKRLFVPTANAKEASLALGVAVYPIASLHELIAHVTNESTLRPLPPGSVDEWKTEEKTELDMALVHGQESAKRALEIAASGAHNILLSGPPGSGKTLLARTLPSILPSMTREEILEVTTLASIAGTLPAEVSLITARPFRAPHHSASAVSLAGGGTYPKPGEISLAHRGVLFLDEFPEFPRYVIETLRQPLEDGIVTVSRAASTVTFPARFMLVASQNPCPCGFFGSDRPCRCFPTQIVRYRKKVSGPILDRIDLHAHVPRIPFEKFSDHVPTESSADIRKRVEAARKRQIDRFRDLPRITTNAEMGNKEIKNFCAIPNSAKELLRHASDRLGLSARGVHRVLKISRTIADLAGSDNILEHHVSEALSYREQPAEAW